MTQTEKLNLPTGDELEALQAKAAEEVIKANTDPSKLTKEQHEEIHALQRLAAIATSAANEAVIR